MSDPVTVSDVGERGLIERIAARLPAAPEGETWSGDDAAVVAKLDGPAIVTTDVMVEHVDFEWSYCGGADVGWKVVAVNTSDIAAMGALPRYAVATLSLPGDFGLDLVDALLDGMLEAAARWNIALVGGDISAASETTVGLTLLGEAAAPGVVLRSGAHAGDMICVTGCLGGAAGGLESLRRNLDLAELEARHLRPVARVDEGRALAELGATAMIDISDGLAVDLSNLLDASGAGCDVDAESIPVDPGLLTHGDVLGFDPLEAAVLGGEDFELLFTIDEGRMNEFAMPATPIGTITSSGRAVGGRSLDEWRDRGWEHLRHR